MAYALSNKEVARSTAEAPDVGRTSECWSWRRHLAPSNRGDPTMASGEIKTYQETLDKVFAAVQKAVRDLGYKVDSMDKAHGLLDFKTDMSWKSWAGQEMSVMLIDNGDGSVEVSISGRRNQSGVMLQAYDWGEAGGIANRVFGGMDEYLR